MGLADVAAEHDAAMREVVYRQTFGHMDANPGTRYKGTITFAETAFSDPGKAILHSDFGNAGFGPWFYEGIHEWLWDQETLPGRIYYFTGYYQLRKDNKHTFVGTITSKEI